MSCPTERAIAAAVLRWTRAKEAWRAWRPGQPNVLETQREYRDAKAALLAIGKRLAKETK